MLKCQRLSSTSKTSKEMGTTFGISDSLGSFGWTRVNYDWLMVFREAINQSLATLVLQTIPQFVAPRATTHCPYSFCYREFHQSKAAYDCLTQGAIYVPCKWTQHCWMHMLHVKIASVCTPCCMSLRVFENHCAKIELDQL